MALIRPRLATFRVLEAEVADIVASYHEWGDVDRSHRKLAHRGSYVGRVWVSPASHPVAVLADDRQFGSENGWVGDALEVGVLAL